MGVILLWITSPYILFITNWYIYAYLWVGWIIFAYFSNPRAFITMISCKYTIIAFIWPLLVCILAYWEWADFSPYQFTISLFLISIIYYISGKYVISLRFFIIIFVIYVLLINNYSIKVLLQNPQAARVLAHADKEVTADLAHPLMANFAYINALSLFSLSICAFLKLKGGRILVKVFFILLLALNVYVLILSQYSLAIITLVIFLFFIVVSNSKHRGRRIIWYFILGFITIFFGGGILLMLSNVVGSSLFSNRLHSLGEFLSSGNIENGSDFQIRIDLYSKSLNAFINNLFIGVGGATYTAGGLVGGHSTILDTFAYYGLFVGLIFMFYLYSIYKNSVRFLDSEMHQIYRIIFISFLFINVFNPGYQEPILFTMFFISPALLFLAKTNTTDKNNINY